MKSRFSLACILGSAIYISQLTVTTFVVAEPGASFTTSSEIERYAIDSIENIHKTALTLLSISPEEQTLENKYIKTVESIYVSGAGEEQNSSAKEYTVLNIKTGSLTEARISDLAHKILSENTDAVCIQEIVDDDVAYDLYKSLYRNYAHFIYAPASLGLEKNHQKRGMLIASKFGAEPLEIFLARSYRDRDDGDRKAGGGWEVGVDIGYGGKDGTQIDGYFKGEAHDDKGNYAEGRFDHNFNKNEGNISARGGNRDEENK